MDKKYQVAIILINYNSSQYTIGCVNSIVDKTDSAIQYRIIIIDNNSSSEQYEKLRPLEGIKNVCLFRSKVNIGFSGANMLGVQLANADYYYFLNNDCILLNDCISILHSFSESNPLSASCIGEMFDSSMAYACSFNYFPSLSLRIFGSSVMRLFYPQKFPIRQKRYDQPLTVDLISGSSMFIRATALGEIGGFDTNYFLYLEEEDIALRLKRKGYVIHLVPAAKFQHFENKSSLSENAIRLPFLKEFYISFLYYYSKNYDSTYKLAIQLLVFFKTLRKFYKNWDYAKLAFFIARGAHMKHSLRFKQKMNL